MIGEFIDSWSLFRDAYLLALSQAALLSLVGILVVARNQIFTGAALAQASTLGVALGVALGLPTAALAIIASVVGALLISRDEGANDRRRVSGDEATAWLFILCTALTTVVLSRHPQGMAQVRRVQLSSFVGATMIEVLLVCALLLFVTVGLWCTRRRLILLIADPVMAAAIGMQVGRWSRGIAVLIGLVIGLAIQSGGMLYTFGCLVLPPLIAKALCRRIGSIFAVAPVVGFGTALVGLVLAYGWDIPQGQLIVALQAVLLLIVWAARRVLRQPSGPIQDEATAATAQ